MPASQFEVVKNFSGIANTAAGFIGGIDTGYTNSGVYFMQKDALGFGSTTTYLMNASINGSSKMVVTGTGNVGIGTTAPAQPLEVQTSAGVTMRLTGTSNTTYTQTELQGTGRRYAVGVGNAGETTWGLANKFFLFDSTGNAPRLTVDTNGNVGIGTTAPGQKLSVAGVIESTTGGLKFPDGSSQTSAPFVSSGEFIVRGTINSNGTIRVGGGFTVTSISTGIKEVTFSTAFSARPTVVVTQLYPSSSTDDFAAVTGNTLDNCVILAAATNKFRTKCGDGTGAASDRAFEFIVIGPR